MYLKIFLILSLSATSFLPFAQPNPRNSQLLDYNVIFGWKQIDFEYKSEAEREESMKSGKFIPENNIITGVKVSQDRIFLTVPRWRPGIPATLVNVPLDRTNLTGPQPNFEPKLVPYPSWEDNEEGNCSVIQYVQSMEIDQFGRMWVVDVGRRNIFEEVPDNKCAPKLVLIDLQTDKFLHMYEFPGDVVSRSSSFLNDLVVGCFSKENCVAYISDARDAKIIAYDLAENNAWFVSHPSMKADPEALIINIQGTNYTFDTAVDGIALSSRDNNFSTIYYSPLSSYNVYSVESAIVKSAQNFVGAHLKDSDVVNIGMKPSQTDGMTIDANGILYYGLLGNSDINTWDTKERSMTKENQILLGHNDRDLQWPDTFSIDESGYLFATPNRLHRFSTNTFNFTDVNFRVVSFFINSKSYMFPRD